jgi:hypothetical protein
VKAFEGRMSSGPGNKRSPFSPKGLEGLGRRARLRLAIAGGGLLVAIVTFATCGGCGKRSPGGGDTTAARASADAEAPPASKAAFAGDAAALRDVLMWRSANGGDVEDLTTLAVHEGAIGLVEAASDPELRLTAIKAMAYARGWAQLPFLTKAASGKNDEEARLALESAVELATRPRRAEDPEDADELREGCDALSRLARDTTRPRPRRVASVRALRMLPCPPPPNGEGLPSDVDAK